MGDVLPFRRPPEDPDTQPCAGCGHAVDRAAIRCRRCGRSTIPASPKRRGLSWWMLLGIILAIAMLAGWLSGRR